MCIAVCLHDEGKGSKLFIASNQDAPMSAKEYMKNLREFVKTVSLESYEKLLNSAVKQICCIGKNDRSNTNDKDKKNLNKFREIAEDYNKKISLKQKNS